MTRDELQGKRVELEQLETRERELVAAEAVPPEPTAAAIPVAENVPAWDSDETIHDMPAITRADEAATLEAPDETEEAATIVDQPQFVETVQQAPAAEDAATVMGTPP